MRFRWRNPQENLDVTAPPAPDLSILIVTWNVWDLLRVCLQSIEQVTHAGPPEDAVVSDSGTGALRYFGPLSARATVEVIVVDNDSSDATARLVPALFPWVHLVRSETNLGFTGGNNLAYALSRGEFVFFLNPDTELITPNGPLPGTRAGDKSGVQAGNAHQSKSTEEGDSLWLLFDAVRQTPGVALAGPQLRYPDNQIQNNRRRFPTALTGFFESTWLGRMWPNNPWARSLHMVDWPAEFSQDVDWIVGAAMLGRRTALEEVRDPACDGPFDEAFFMYSEELDLCRRLSDKGWRVAYIPRARVVHYEGRSSEQVVAARHIHFNTSKVYYYQKYFGPRWAEILRQFLLLEFRWQLWVEQLKATLGHKRELRRQRVAAYKAVLSSELRPAQDTPLRSA